MQQMFGESWKLTKSSERFEHVANTDLYIPIIGPVEIVSPNPDAGAQMLVHLADW